MAEFPIVEEYIEKFVILNEIGQWESFRTNERIVRCRDCKYYEYLESIDFHDCERQVPSVNPDGFCAWGKVKAAKMKINPCKFCNSKDMYLVCDEDRFGCVSHKIFCNQCKTSFSNEEYEDTEEETLEWWNSL